MKKVIGHQKFVMNCSLPVYQFKLISKTYNVVNFFFIVYPPFLPFFLNVFLMFLMVKNQSFCSQAVVFISHVQVQRCMLLQTRGTSPSCLPAFLPWALCCFVERRSAGVACFRGFPVASGLWEAKVRTALAAFCVCC